MKSVIGKGCIFGLSTAVSLCSVNTAYAFYEAPSDIELTVGDFECEGDDILSAETVELPLYIGNNPGFVSMTLIVRIGDGLRYDAECPVYTRTDGLGGVHMYDFSDEYDTMVFTVTGSDEFIPFSEDGEIAVFRFSPTVNFENGDCNITFLSEFGDHKMEILTANSFDAVFGEECFSIMNGHRNSIADPNGNGNADSGDGALSDADRLSVSQNGVLPDKNSTVSDENSDDNSVVTTTRKPHRVRLDKSNSDTSDSARKKSSSYNYSAIAVTAVAVIFVSAFIALSAAAKKKRKKGNENNE